jgi:hypothetical protein
MPQNDFLVPVTENGQRVLDLVKTNPKEASQIMESLSDDEQASLVSHQALRDPKGAEDLLFLLKDRKSSKIVSNLGDRTVFRIMKSQSSTHIGILSLLNPERVQSILDLDQELFSSQGLTDDETAYHWMISFLEEDEATFTDLLMSLDIKVVASAFQNKVRPPMVRTAAGKDEEDDEPSFPADFLVKLDRAELKPDDLDVTDEETRDILTRIHLVDEVYFNQVVSLMMREKDLKRRTAEEALDRIHEQVGDMTAITEEAEDMFVPLEE